MLMLLADPTFALTPPQFDGSDPNGWIFRVEEYFEFYARPQPDRLRLVGLFMEGAASEWFRWVRNNIVLNSWEDFVSQIRLRFDPHHFEDYFGALSNLKQTSSVAAYQSDFEHLLNKVTGVLEAALLSVFIAGLQPHLRRELHLWRPSSLSAAFAVACEVSAIQVDTFSALALERSSSSPHQPATLTSKELPLSNAPHAHSGNSIRRITAVEKPAKDAQGLCYWCDQKWSRSHRCQSRLLLLFSNDEPDNEDQPTDHHEEPIADDISLMNSLSTAIQPRSLRLKGTIHTSTAQILIDGGSNHNFIHPRLVDSLQLLVQLVTSFQVYVGNGDSLKCSQQCPKIPLTMQGSKFTVDLFVLPIHGSDIKLGVQWLQLLGTVAHNYANLTMEFDWEENRVFLQRDTSIPSLHLEDKVVVEPEMNDTSTTID